eukprot:1595594-Amphidinium_carterae.2
MWTLKGLVQFMWGQPGLARGWITKRVQGWSSRSKQCGLHDFTLRQSMEGIEKTLARSACMQRCFGCHRWQKKVTGLCPR